MKNNAVTTEVKTAIESHILNGRSNLNYNKAQFDALSPEIKKSYLWGALVSLDLNNQFGVKNDTITAATFDEIFTLIQEQKTTVIPENIAANINGCTVTSAAQGITLLAYGDSNNGHKYGLKCRTLDYNVACNDFADFLKCLSIISQYNEFEYSNLESPLTRFAKLTAFYGETNPNNGMDVLKYKVGRESSPVFYISFNSYLSPKIEVERNGAEVKYRQFDEIDFKNQMESLQSVIKADEFEVDTLQISSNFNILTARFWFD